MNLFEHVHEVLHLIVMGAEVAPDTKADVEALFIDFAEKAQPILQAQLREDLMKTPPDDRDATWHKYLAATEEETN